MEEHERASCPGMGLICLACRTRTTRITRKLVEVIPLGEAHGDPEIAMSFSPPMAPWRMCSASLLIALSSA
jgi:hypothetical protein